MSRDFRSKVVSAIGGRNRCRVIALARANSRSPSGPCVRPNPDSPTPPNGSPGTVTNPSTEFTEVIPVRSARAAASPADRLPLNTADPSPYRPPLASVTPASSDGTGVTVTTGPNVSSVTAALDSGTPVSTTGPAQLPATLSGPPTAAVPPRESASATCDATSAPCDGNVKGPYDAPGSDPGRKPATRAVSRSRKEW